MCYEFSILLFCHMNILDFCYLFSKFSGEQSVFLLSIVDGFPYLLDVDVFPHRDSPRLPALGPRATMLRVPSDLELLTAGRPATSPALTPQVRSLLTNAPPACLPQLAPPPSGSGPSACLTCLCPLSDEKYTRGVVGPLWVVCLKLVPL